MYSAHIRRISSAPDVKSFETIPDEHTFYNLFVNFNRRQRRFHASLPTVRGTPLNLYSLFTSVVKHGGYSKVTEKDLWETVSKDIGCPSACANYSVALRRVYCHYLVAFENESYPHLKNDSLWSQIQDEFHENPGDVFTPPSVERMLGIFNPKPAPIHYGMHRSATHLGFASRDLYPTLRCNQDSRIPSSFDQLPPSQQLEELHSRPHPDNSLELRHVSVLETAEKSLMSGLPNEVDLSLNSVLFLSAVVHSSPATPLRLSSSRNLLQLMLASVGVYEDGPSSLRPLSQSWNSASNLNFDGFWRDAVGDSVISSLREDAYLYQEHSEPLVQDAETAGYRVVPPPSPDTTHDLFSPSPSHARQFFGPTGSAVGNGYGSDDCLSSNAPLSRVLMVVATLVNCVTPPYLPGLPPPLEEDDDEIEQMMAFASMRGRRAFSGSGGLSETGGRPFRGRSLFPAPGLIPPLSAWRENARFLSSQPCALRFAFLCAYARHSALRQLGLQLVSGLRYPLVPTTSTSTAPTNSATVSIRVPRPLHLNTFTGIELVSLRFLIRCLFQSADRCDLLAGLNLLTNLLRVPEGVNVECLFAGLPRSLWCRLIQLLCLSDLGLVCAVLEALYTATGMGGFACTRLWGALASADDTVSKRAPSTVFAARRASIHLRPLLAFLSLEGQSMGPGSLHRVKVMQRQPQPVLTPMQPSAPPPSHMVMGQPVMHYPLPFHSHPHSYHHHFRPAAPPPPLQYLPQQAPRHSPPPTSPQPTPNPHLVPSRPFTLPSQTRLILPPSPRSTSSSPSLASLLGPSSVSSPATATSPGGLAVPPQVANVKPEASSLSELTDRLQMPPPQMPPPRRTSTRVNGAAAFTPNRSPHVNGEISTPLVNSLVNHRLPQHHYLLSPRKSSSKSLLEEVLNSPSNKNIPPLVNGCGGGSGSGSTIHHIPSMRNDLVVSAAPSIKLVNGESAPVKKQLPVKTEPPLVNGVFHENENVTMRESEKPNKVKVKEESDDEAEAREEEDDKWMEAKLVEVATFFTHYLCFNRRVGFYYTRKRPRNFALRNRVLKGAFSILPDDTAYSCSPTKRRKVDLKSESTKTAMSSQLQQQVQLPPPPTSPPMFVCEWGGCSRRFPVAKQVSCHVYKCHLKSGLPSASSAVIPAPIERRCCQWADCASTHLPRAPFALMSHVLEHHCSAGELECRRRSIAITSSAPPLPPSYPLSVNVPDQSGWAIIKEVETRRLQSDLWVSQCAISGRYYNAAAASGAGGGGRIVPPPREGPVTKHLRVTAALILRNLAKHVPEARRWLLSETPLLCEIAMGTCPGPSSLRTNDAGRIIAQCLSICTSHNLHDLDDFHSHYCHHYSHRRLVLGAAGDEDTDDCPYCCFVDDDYYNDEDDDYCGYYESSGGRLPLLHRLALLRQRSSVDLDA
ncbi:AT rich interaction region [Echinococcus multilocularis]|uniref:AT rich interaction region n=1 Tax=Echinococcus multilocularis TaxID=6211 RepID=A0A068XX90_ECHMU|nr:AT rich interaction region [Echinococcus multilocularis]